MAEAIPAWRTQKEARFGERPLLVSAAAVCLLALCAPGAATELEDRIALECPAPEAGGDYAEPSEIYPSPEAPFVVEYSIADETVLLVGPGTESVVTLGSGDDVAFLYETGVGTVVQGDAGADTFVLCSMEDLMISITLGTESLARDADRDVVVIGSSVFATVPAGMRRGIEIMGFDAATDMVVIRAPADLIEGRKTHLAFRGLQLGDVFITILPAFDAPEAKFTGEAFVFTPAS